MGYFEGTTYLNNICLTDSVQNTTAMGGFSDQTVKRTIRLLLRLYLQKQKYKLCIFSLRVTCGNLYIYFCSSIVCLPNENDWYSVIYMEAVMITVKQKEK